ncbi:2Fe-2S iron-sulfur cluster-binding protein, partial [Streptomyces sp. 4F14]|uniref:2Fe-2S iron-sulfur cluster-binding protein n=1 Tax=Streptomyces sp. 4F14 TaxID=3394380 RepID=UPI003A88AB6C
SRTTRGSGRPGWWFCGIGGCFYSVGSVIYGPSQRGCLVPARAGDVIRTQEGTGHAD